MISIRIARELIRIARLLVAKDWTNEIQKKRPDLDAEAVNNALRGYSDPKEQKMVAYWLLDKKSLDYPFDNETGKSIEQAWSMLNDPLNTKLKLDFMKFRSPAELISFVNGQANAGNVRTEFNPDTEPAFSNKKNLGSGVVVYEVEDSKAGQIAVRKALDDAWGPNFNGWCLAARKSNFGPRQLEEFDRLTESQKERLGFYSEDDLAVAWKNWEVYSEMPKRAAFKGGKIFAFSASNKRDTVLWWDKSNSSSSEIPGVNVLDDVDFLAKYGKINIASNPAAYFDQNPELFDEIMNDVEFRRKIAKNPNTPPEMLVKMWNDEDRTVKWGVASNRHTPPDTLAKMWNDEDKDVKRNVAMNPNTPPEMLVKMWDDEDGTVRWGVAGNPHTPPDTLAKMWDDKSIFVRQSVAKNPNTPPDTLAKMWEDKNKLVREGVARNPNTPTDALAKMWNDEADYVRTGVASNPSTPSDVLVKMLDDENNQIRNEVLKNPNYIG